ncbi:fimbria/pilus outer membrane usher protein [Serratia sp. L9]|uniref:fimbria/pilus outer membrane usher protein n=1 Tax=Serratia sp. L9 TaxID=3423946 RepID=UPI003D67C0B6
MEFNPQFIHGSGIDVSRFSERNPVLPGKYDVTLFVNGENRGKQTVIFVLPPEQVSAEPCFTLNQLSQAGIWVEELQSPLPREAQSQCAFISDWIAQGNSNYNGSDFELNLGVPQLYKRSIPSGYIDPSRWDAGETVGFLDYRGNVYSLFHGGNDGSERQNSYTSNLLLAGGINLGRWRLRKRLNLGWVNGSSPTTQNLYGYIARDVAALKSELVLGETNTIGDMFDSYGLRGVLLHSDERMLPDSLRSYSPVLRGVAQTNARVKVIQRGLTIFETVVPPGPFELSDIGTMGYGADLTMIVTEADGRQQQQNISFSVPPILLREGVSRFEISAGQLKDEKVKDYPGILQGSYRYGATNSWTLYGGAQVADKYQALAVGNAFNTPIGGIAVDVTHAKSGLGNRQHASGNSVQVSFTKYLENTDTHLTLAAYRYSSSGFYTFRESNQIRTGGQDENDSVDFRSRHRLSVTLSQRIQDNMTLLLNGSLYTYWGGRSSSRQYSATINHSLRNFSYGLTAIRARNEKGRDENSLLLSVNIPLGERNLSKPLFNSLYSTLSHNNRGDTQLQTLMNGSQGEQDALSYGIGGTFGHRNDRNSEKSVTGNLSYQSGLGRFGLSASANNRRSQQLSVSGDGSIVAHKGGITIGPAIGDAPFAIIGAKGATGARLLNGRGAKVDSHGYAIMPSLSPYRENTVSLDARGLPDTVDVLENEKVVVPGMGAAIAVDMQTITGAPQVLTVRDEQQDVLPIGTVLQNAAGVSQGIIGQGGQAFVRGWQPAEQPLYVVLEGKKRRCVSTSNRTINTLATQITQLEVTCLRNGQ